MRQFNVQSIEKVLGMVFSWTSTIFFPISFKRALAKTLFYRVERICTADKLGEELMKNGDKCYPCKFTDKCKKAEGKTT